MCAQRHGFEYRIGDFMITAITYGDDNFTQSVSFNIKCAKKYGKADRVISFSPRDIDKQFFKKNSKILSSKRGGGYWLWKPYFIDRVLSQINDNDYLVYSDAGTFFMSDLHNAVDKMLKLNTDVLISSVNYLEGMYSKRDAFVYMGVEGNGYEKTNQLDAAFLMLKKTPRTISLVKEWLNYCCNFNIISDEENTCGLPNYDHFVENRYDQTVLSLVCKKEGYSPCDNLAIPNPIFTCIEPLSFVGKGKYSYLYDSEAARKDLINQWSNSTYFKPLIVRTRYRNMNPLLFKMKILSKVAKYKYRNNISFFLTQQAVKLWKVRINEK